MHHISKKQSGTAYIWPTSGLICFYFSAAQAPPRRWALKRELFLIAGARSDRGITGALAAAATKTRVQMSVNFGALWLRKIGAADN